MTAPSVQQRDASRVVQPDGIDDPAYALYAEPQRDERGVWRIAPPGSHQESSGALYRDRAVEQLERIRGLYAQEAERRQRRFGDLDGDARHERLCEIATRAQRPGWGTDVTLLNDGDLRDYRDLLAVIPEHEIFETGRRHLREANAELQQREAASRG